MLAELSLSGMKMLGLEKRMIWMCRKEIGWYYRAIKVVRVSRANVILLSTPTSSYADPY
jgi:hypothetical protein